MKAEYFGVLIPLEPLSPPLDERTHRPAAHGGSRAPREKRSPGGWRRGREGAGLVPAAEVPPRSVRLGLSGERERKAALCGGTQQSFPQGRVLFPYLPARVWSLYAPVILCSVFFLLEILLDGNQHGHKARNERKVRIMCVYIYIKYL